MDVKPISAVDAINPAFESMKRIMFRPFRWSRWWRVGMLALATGEMAKGGGCSNFNIPTSIPSSSQGTHNSFVGTVPWARLGLDPATIALLVTVLVVGVVVLLFVHIYVGSVVRFMLFDSVARERFGLLEGWRHWHPQGMRYFGFQLVMLVVSLAAFGALAAIALLAAFAAGVAKNPHGHPGLIVLGVLGFLPLILLVALVLGLVNLFAKDFAVPIMALENKRASEALRQVWSMIRATKSSYAAYAGMKFVLSLAEGVMMGIIDGIILLVLAIPVVIVAVAAGVTVPGVFQNPAILAGIITVGIIGIFVLLFVFATLGSPITIFFQAYVLHFFAPRYRPLWDLMNPVPPSEIPPLPPVSPITSGPITPPIVPPPPDVSPIG